MQGAELGDLGWGWKSITGAIKKGITAPTKLAYKTTKWAVKRTIIEPTKIAAKGALAVGKGTVAVGTNIAKGKGMEALKSVGRVALAPAQTVYATGKSVGTTVYQASKAVTDFALAPLRSRLNTLKSRRAALLAYQARGTKVPTTAEKAQARKDVKAMLSRKGPHGKMLSWLAGPDYSYDGLGIVGYDDAAIAAVATALTGTAIKIISDAAKSKFAPVDAAKAGIAAGASQAIKQIVPEQYQTAYRQAQAAESPVTPEEAPAAPVEPEEVAAEPAVEAQEAATAAETEAMEGALADEGLLGGFMEAVPDAVVPEAMELTTARKLSIAAHRMVCQMSAPAIAAIGGPAAVHVAGTFCRALKVGDEATVRATLPTVVEIAAAASAGLAARSLDTRLRAYGALPNEGFGAARRTGKKGRKLTPFQSCVNFQTRELGVSQEDAEYACQGVLQGVTGDDIGMLAAFAGADPEGLSFGLAEVRPEDLNAAENAEKISTCSLLPMAFLVGAGFWMMTRG
jgi:hypothetical protein